MKFRQKNDGFSLIELMIVVAIIGVLSSIAVPAYRNYMLKAKMSELISYGGNLTNQVAMYLSETGATAIGGTACSGIAATTDITNSKITNNYTISAGCTITVTGISGAIGAGASSVTIVPQTMEADGSVNWRCTALPNTYAPATCNGT